MEEENDETRNTEEGKEEVDEDSDGKGTTQEEEVAE